MGNRANEAFSIGIVSAALIAAFLVSMPSLAAAGRDDRGRPSLAEGIISMVNKRLCDRQQALAGRLTIQLIHPSKCFTQPDPDPDPTVTLTANPQTIDEGESATLTWASTNATECTASDGWSGTKSTSGSQSVSPSVTTTYHLDCEGPGGVGGDDVTVTVIPAEEPEDVTVEITANPMNIIEGGSSTLTWNSDNADSCTASGGWSGDKAVDGTQSVSPTATTTYTIECDGAGDSTASDSVTVGVSADAPDMGTLVVRKLVIRDDGDTSATTTFSFKVNNGATTTFDADGENSMSVVVGTYSVVENTATGFTTSYNNCSNVAISDGETEICTITNNDIDDTVDPTVSISASRMTVTEGSVSGATTTLIWNSTDATECTASNGWSGTKSVDGSETVTPTATTTYAITCTGEGGSANDSVTVNFVPEVEPAPSGNLLITEVHYDLASSTPAQGDEAVNEWIELYNDTNLTLNLGGYFITDNSETFIIPAGVTLEPDEFLLITGSSSTANFWTVPSTASWLVLGGFGGGTGQLANGGDVVELFNTASSSVDAVSWGSNSEAFSGPGLVVPTNVGMSIGRSPLTSDTGTAADWQIQTPNPGN